MEGFNSYFVYILTNQKNGTLYVGVTNNIQRRMIEHKQGEIEGFTQKYKVNKLVYFEEYYDIKDAIHREKCLKRWKRDWKIKLVIKTNPSWNDLSQE